jgi:DNA helicase HerA-like ATPase
MDEKLIAAARAAFPAGAGSVVLGAPLSGAESHPEPLVRVPLGMLNRHGLVAGATGTGKTKTLQLIAEQLSAAGVPVFVADLKGDLSGIAAPGEASERVTTRARDTGFTWQPNACPVELLSLSGKLGAQVRATVSSFGPLLLAKVLDLNPTQTSVLALVFKYCDDRGLELYDFADLRAVLQHLTGAGAAELAALGGMSKATVGVLLREMVELEQQGALAFFGEPELELSDLLRTTADGKGVVSVLVLADVQDKPALFSTFMMWLLARLFAELPELGDPPKPKLVFFFDEAHLLFRDASPAFLDQVGQVVRLVRSKGVGIFFVTQNPKDVPAEILGQLGTRVQHALRAFTPDDDKALRAAARTFPKTDFYDVEEVLTTLGTGEALISALAPNGAPTQPFATRLIPPASRMGVLSELELRGLLATPQVQKYRAAVDRESAHEKLLRKAEQAESAKRDAEEKAAPSAPARADDGVSISEVLNSPLARTVANAFTRGVLGALFGSPRRRRR